MLHLQLFFYHFFKKVLILTSDYNQIKPLDVINYNIRGKTKNRFKNFLVLKVTKKGITTLPLTPAQARFGRPQDRYNVRLNADVAYKLHKHLNTAPEAYVRPLDINVITPEEYSKAQGKREANLTQLGNLDKSNELIDQINYQVNNIVEDYRNFCKLSDPDLPEHERDILLKRHTINPKDLQGHSIMAFMGGHKGPNGYYNIAPYKTDAYQNSEQRQHHLYNFQHKKRKATYYANLNSLKPMSIIRYIAATGNNTKWRPFLVTNVSKKNIKVIPITHTLPNEGPFSIYNVEMPKNISQEVSIMCGDGFDRAKNNKSALNPLNQITLRKKDLINKQLPQYLGDLNQHCYPTNIDKMIQNCNKSINDLYQAYANYKHCREVGDGHIHHYQQRYLNKELISDQDLAYFTIGRDLNVEHMRTPIDSMQPVATLHYLRDKKDHTIKYGVHQESHNHINNKNKHVEPIKQQDDEPEF